MGGRLPLNPYPWLPLELAERFWGKSKFTGLGGKNHRSLTGYNRSLSNGSLLQMVLEWVLGHRVFGALRRVLSFHLVGGFNPDLNNYIVKMDHFPMVWGESRKYVQPPPSHSITVFFWDGLTHHSGQIIRFHHPRKGISCTKPPFGGPGRVRSLCFDTHHFKTKQTQIIP